MPSKNRLNAAAALPSPPRTPHNLGLRIIAEIDSAVAVASLFVSVGSSGSVYPALAFVSEARAWGVTCCEINLEPSDNAYLFDEAHYGPVHEMIWAKA